MSGHAIVNIMFITLGSSDGSVPSILNIIDKSNMLLKLKNEGINLYNDKLDWLFQSWE